MELLIEFILNITSYFPTPTSTIGKIFSGFMTIIAVIYMSYLAYNYFTGV